MCVTTSSVEHEVGKADNLPQWLMGAATATNKDLGTQVGQKLTAFAVGVAGVVCGLWSAPTNETDPRNPEQVVSRITQPLTLGFLVTGKITIIDQRCAVDILSCLQHRKGQVKRMTLIRPRTRGTSRPKRQSSARLTVATRPMSFSATWTRL